MLMSEPIRVDPEALADAVKRMTEFGRYAEAVLAQVDSLVAQLPSSRTGKSATAHAEALRHWARGTAMMHAALARLRDVAAPNLTVRSR